MKPLALIAALFGAIMLYSISASAATNDELFRRLEALESSNAKLQQENADLRIRMRRLEGSKKVARTEPNGVSEPVSGTPAAAYRTVPPSPRPFNWTGIYVGAHSGYALGKILAPGVNFDFAPKDFNGWFGGAQLGVNYQLSNNWVVGAVADFSLTDINTSQQRIDGVDFFRVDQLGTVRGRLGYARDRTLLYATGGFAWGNMKVTDREFGPNAMVVNPRGLQATDAHTHFGYAVGAGVEQALFENVTLGVEYLWVDLPTQSYTFNFPPPQSSGGGRVGWQGSTLKFGVNWLLN